MSGTESEKKEDAPRPALRREGRWLVVRQEATTEDHILIEKIRWIRASGNTVVIFAETSHYAPPGYTVDALRALIDEALDEAADTAPKSEALGLAYELDNKQDDIDKLRARVAELDGDTDNYSREQLQETLEAVAGERDRALNDVWSLEKENRKLREGRKGYRQAIRNLQRAYENECRRNREIRETLRAVGARPTALEKEVGILSVRAQAAEARVAELEEQLDVYKADEPRTFASAVPVEISPPGRETHRGRPVLTEEECAAMPCPLPPEEPESDDLDEWKACVRAWSEWAGREVRGLRANIEAVAEERDHAQAEVAALRSRVEKLEASSKHSSKILHEASKLVPIGSTPSCAKAAPRRKTSEELDAEWREWQQAGKSYDDFLEFLRERDAQRPSYQDDEAAALRARVAEVERDRDAARAHANDLTAKLMRADARLRAVVEPARALYLWHTHTRPAGALSESRRDELGKLCHALATALANLEKETTDAAD